MKKTIKFISVLAAISLLAGNIIPAMAADKTELATREYVVSEFVQSVGRNNLTGSEYILSTFSDADEISEEYHDDFAKAVTSGILRGYDDKTLHPQENVKRIEAMVMLARCLPETEDVTDAIDFYDVPSWAKEDMDRLTRAGLVKGYGDGRLGADDNITVEQVKFLTDRSDEALNTVTPSESFFGYINNKAFRNYDTSKETSMDAVHGVVVTNENSWSNFEALEDDIYEKENEILKQLINGELEYSKNSPEQRVYDLYDCIVHADDDNDIDEAVFIAYRNKILDAKTPDEFIEAAAEIYRETGIGVFISADIDFDSETNIIYPNVSLTATNNAAILAYDKDTEDDYANAYKAAMSKYIGLIDKSFTKNDIDAAYNIQKALRSSEDYFEYYYMLKMMRCMSDPNYSYDLFDAELTSIAKQHPEFFSEDYDLSPTVMSAEDANELNGNIKISDFITSVGYKNFDNVIFDYGKTQILRNASLSQSSLDAYKINAIMLLGEYLDFATTAVEKQAMDDMFDVIEYAVAGADIDGFGYDYYEEDWDEESEFEDNISHIRSLLPNDIGLIYCDYYYDDKTTEVIADMVDDIWDAYLNRFDNNQWLDEEAKAGAKNKIDNMIAIIAYPDNYDFPEIIPRSEGGTYFGNVLNISKDDLNTSIRACADQEFVRTIMYTSPDEVNAYYSPAFNNMNIPAGILNKPFYDPEASYAQNLGAIGCVIGHEIGHAFDLEGSNYDETGAENNWWSDEAAEAFEEKMDYFIDYYSDFEVMDGLYQNSIFTISENMADFAGITAVMDIIGDDKAAQKEALESFARMWATISSDSAIESYYFWDVHSVAQVRVNACVASLDCFYELYDVSEGDPMYIPKEKRLTLW